jgi:hypothetical protein
MMNWLSLFWVMVLFGGSTTSSAQGNTGLIRVACDGDNARAEIFVNDKSKGDCPVDIQAQEGVQVLRAVKPVDQKTERVFEETFRLAAGTAKRIEVQLSKPVLTRAALAEQARFREVERKDFEALLAKAKAGDMHAQFDLARIYDKGNLAVEPKSTQALYWYLKAAGYGKSSVGALYVNVTELSGEIAKRIGYDGTQGVILTTVFTDGPAAAAGLLENDIVLGVDGKAISNQIEFISTIKNTPPGQIVNVRVWRKGRQITIPVITGERMVDAPPELPPDGHFLSNFLIFTHDEATRKILAQKNLLPRIDRLSEQLNVFLKNVSVSHLDVKDNFLSYIADKKIFAPHYKAPTGDAILANEFIAESLINLKYHFHLRQLFQADIVRKQELHSLDWFFGNSGTLIREQPNVWGLGWTIRSGSNLSKYRMMCGIKRKTNDKIWQEEFDCLRLIHEHYRKDASSWGFEFSRLRCAKETCFNEIIHSSPAVSINLLALIATVSR